MSQLGRLTGLQWGRGLAAAAVVAGHSIGYYNPGVHEFAGLLGKTGVTLFFVISGFIMVVTTGTGQFNPRTFAIKRYLRIAPLYYVATFVTAASVLLAPSVFKKTTFDLAHIFWSLLFIPVQTPDTGVIEPFMPLGWTLNFEMFFYACFAAMFWLKATQRAVVLTLLFSALIVAGMLIEFSFPPLAFYARFDISGFIGGIWAGILWQKAGPWLGTKVSGPLLVALSLLLLLGLSFIYGPIRHYPETTLIFVAICTLAVIGLAVGFKGEIGAVWRPLTLIGDASYSIYLFHMFALGMVFRVFGNLVTLPMWLLVPLGTMAGITAGIVVYLLLERYLTRLLRKPSYRSATDTKVVTATS